MLKHLLFFKAYLLTTLTFNGIEAAVSSCTLSVVRCCDPQNQLDFLPGRCFEVNGCAGLIWIGKTACSRRRIARAVAAIDGETMSIRALDSNTVDVDIANEEDEDYDLIDLRGAFDDDDDEKEELVQFS